METKNKRLFDISREFKIGKSKILDMLNSKGFVINNSPTQIITTEMYEALVSELPINVNQTSSKIIKFPIVEKQSLNLNKLRQISKIKFGVVSNYFEEKGFGFVKNPLDPLNFLEIFFHISTIRKDDIEIYNKLPTIKQDKPIIFWYEIEITPKGNKVGRLIKKKRTY